jgi:predicted N-acyltransferase
LSEDYVIRVKNSPLEVNPAEWDALLTNQSNPSPFMRHAYLAALHHSGSASPNHRLDAPLLHLCARANQLVAACVLYEKNHSYGEYVFDWAWANAYAQHGLLYYPKAVGAVPFTPVPGAADGAHARKHAQPWCRRCCAGANRVACRRCTCCFSTTPMQRCANKRV